ncbi:3-oxoacyl-[acyl-carrier-protein] synthase 3 [Seminavis robusta]|uniref:3-oxoacyl-[acyl-carrier-protein] synthase 3 n=1 Tax=Seminavis robusta TaxID=568900 RepID=A0A9N8H633_9STRA|nr:3-oxoacyl-[acyl-carrier-protein] synthase 3 [Seminavis robusta]|eukprot:Sro133_g063010.1 3-oxoacyl-[acyl-carrier-protein] synthase 3 (381) ;mRNA; f:49810-50952
MQKLVDAGIHNPKTGKPVALDWAKRYLGSTSIAIADVSEFERVFDQQLTEDCKDISEFDMSVSAAKMALDEAGVSASEIDCIIHVSGSNRVPKEGRRDDLGLNNCMRGFTTALSGLRPDCLLQHQDSGCAGVVPPFQMAKAMLSCGDFKNILVITSNVFHRRDWKETTKANEMTQWINFLLFGDGASAFVLQGTHHPSEVLETTKSNTCFELLKVNSVSDTSMFTFQTYVEANKDTSCIQVTGRLNTDAAKQFVPKMREWLSSQGIKISQLDALLLHQPNSHVMQKIKQFLAGDKLLDVSGKYGNLVSASLGTQFYEQIYSSGKNKMKHGGLVAGFTFGAHAGNTYGGFLARIHVGEEDETMASGPSELHLSDASSSVSV